jgi:UDP-glucose 4-epimerase
MMFNEPILLTGSRGLVGQTLLAHLRAAGREVREFDIRLDDTQNVCKYESLHRAIVGCSGVVHLAAVSRVVWGERDPVLCRDTNIGGTRNVLRVLFEAKRPWLLFASSREVYGLPPRLPATELDPLAPINEYGRAKAAAEAMIEAATRDGLIASVARLSNVYGRTDDHPDRVVPAFARAAALGSPMRVDGIDHLFDFTHVEDTVLGLMTMIHILDAGRQTLPPIHLLTGRPTSLGELAEIANRAGSGRSTLVEAPPRNYDVPRFWGDPARARALLGWSPTIDVVTGVGRLVGEFVDQRIEKALR